MKIRPTRFSAPTRGKPLRQQIGHVADDRVAEVLDLIPAVLAGQWHHQVNALASAGLEKRLEPQFIEHRKGQRSGFDHAFPWQRRIRVEVEDEAVGLVQIV
jgi:hypothetical protein